jgi:lipoprotein-anchoring transpeptidase ErfK/SrfK
VGAEKSIASSQLTSALAEPTAMSKRKNHAKQIVVDLDSQTLQTFEGGTRVLSFECVTGSKDHPTEPGQYRILRKSPNHVSHAYNVPMHWAMFFTTDGKAFHQYHGMVPLSVVRGFKEHVTDHLGSHGCVRLTEANAKTLYDWADYKTSVIIKGQLT